MRDRRPWRVVLVAPFGEYPKGTTRARVLPLARALADRGHDVTVLVPPYDHPAEGGRVYWLGQARVESLPVPVDVPEQSPRQAIAQPRLALELARRALSVGPDVVHIFKPKAVSGLTQALLWYRRLLARRGRRPALVLDTDDWEGFGGWNEYEAYPYWQKVICDWQERWGLRHADALTVASRTLETQAWSHRVAPPRVAYLPNGLDPANYPGWRAAAGEAARRRWHLQGRPVLLLYTRFFEFAPERALHVLARVQAAIPDVCLLVAGAGKYGQERRLAAFSRERGLADAVVVAGWQPLAALPGVLAAGDVALFPCDDTLANRAKCSIKLLELLWLGKPVVADRVGQQAEYVAGEAGATAGLLSDPEDPASMAAAAIALLRDPARAARLGQAARRRAEATFNWPALATRAERAYAAAQGLGDGQRPAHVA